jgi:hypothetical protein
VFKLYTMGNGPIPASGIIPAPPGVRHYLTHIRRGTIHCWKLLLVLDCAVRPLFRRRLPTWRDPLSALRSAFWMAFAGSFGVLAGYLKIPNRPYLTTLLRCMIGGAGSFTSIVADVEDFDSIRFACTSCVFRVVVVVVVVVVFCCRCCSLCYVVVALPDHKIFAKSKRRTRPPKKPSLSQKKPKKHSNILMGQFLHTLIGAFGHFVFGMSNKWASLFPWCALVIPSLGELGILSKTPLASALLRSLGHPG